MNIPDLILVIYSSPETVFTVAQLEQMNPAISPPSLRDRLRYFARVGKLIRIRQGIYGKSNFNPLELANKIYSPSYVSLETVLLREGVTFQVYETTFFLLSYLKREVKSGEYIFEYRQIKQSVLTNMTGIVRKVGYFEATKERAFLDALYIYKNYHFDNLGGLDWGKIHAMVDIYESKAMIMRVNKYYHAYKEEWDVEH
ncbi:MAG: hypothetical protein UX21_C0040G0007 [Microgenomates group bacterium GW2011_GWC2_45_8]|nr:MAG: hypothetical protein UX21_C0040G0007 [Microgenomates group bacterium GW2011_GWC2_45_8]